MNKINIVTEVNRNFKKNRISIYKLDKKIIKRILIIKWGGMGDVIISSAPINDILNHFNKSSIDINTLPSWKVFFKNDKRIRNIWGFNFGKGINKIKNIFNWLLIVKRNNYDLIIDFQTNDRSRIMLFFLRFFLSFNGHILGNHQQFPYTIKPYNLISKFSSPLAVLQNTISSIGINPKSNSPKIVHKRFFQNNLNFFNKKKIYKKKFIIFIPGSSFKNPLKRWGVDNFYNLSKLLEKKGFSIVLVGGPDDIYDCNLLIKLNKKIINLCNKINLENLVDFFKSAKYIVGNDTGPGHLAACTSTPTIIITGPTNPYLVKPNSNKVISIQSNIECKSCYKKICNHHSCMFDIKPDFVFTKLMEL